MAWIDSETGRPYTEKELAGMRTTAPEPDQTDLPQEHQTSVQPKQPGTDLENFGSGAVASLKKTYLGLKQVGTYLTGNPEARQAVNDEITRMEKEYGPILDTKAGKAGELVGTVGQFLVPGSMAARVGKAIPATAEAAAKIVGKAGGVRRAATTAGAFEGAQPITPGNTRTEDLLIQKGARALAGTAAGGGVGAVASRMTRAAVPQAPELTGIEREAERIGLTGDAALTAAQRTGDRDLLQYEEGLLASPGSQNLIKARRNAQHDKLNRSASTAMGYPNHAPTEAVFGAAKENVDLAYEPISKIDKLRTDVPYFDDLGTFIKKTKSKDAASLAKVIKKDGSLSGDAFLETLQDVRDFGFHASHQGDRYTARQYKKLGTIMEDFLDRRLADLSKQPGNLITTDTMKEFRNARTQRSVIHELEKSTDPVLGTVNPNKVLKSQFARQGYGAAPSPTTHALKEVADISRVMRKTMPYIGSSGTAERLGGMRMVQADMNPLEKAKMAVPMVKNYLAAKRYLAHGGEPGVFGSRFTPAQNAFIRRMLPPEVIGTGEAAAD